MVLKTAAALGAGLMVAGCVAGCAARYTPTPLATNFPVSKQPKLQAAEHWAVIAGHIEQQLKQALAKQPPRPLYIADTPQATPFQRALTGQLVTALVNDGYTVSRTAPGSLKVELDMQAVTFSANRPQYRYHGEHAALASGVWVLSEIDLPPLAIVAAGVGAYDSYNWFDDQFAPGAPPRTEIILTVSVTDQYRYLARNSSAYYVADGDRPLYGIVDVAPEAPKLTRMFKVRGDM